MKFSNKAIASIFIFGSSLIVGCGEQATIEQCQIVTIEPREFQIEFGDVDAEGGEVEMVCNDTILDVPWNQFRRRMSLDPNLYMNNVEGFRKEVSCLRDERLDEQVVACSKLNPPGQSVSLKFTYDD